MTTDNSKHILITNLEYVVVNGVRTFTHALLLTEGKAFFRDGVRRELRGFGTDPAWPTFDLTVPSMIYTLMPASNPHVVMITDAAPEGRPLLSGAIMQIEGGPRVDLVVSNPEQPLDIQTFDGSILQVWQVLPRLVRKYWTAPNMPALHWDRVNP